ncbi:methylated-DNA--[protein]-cysteine S-methyltransferase [Amycolatopsis xylanica]|nr:methylated-DNA--[protein]-cysteine S-methyltransferase [Amycolatopsis xylanica]
MDVLGFAMFGTAIGSCGIAWGERGIVGVWLPESSEAKTRARLAGLGAPEAEPPDSVRKAIADIVDLLNGTPNDLADIVVDLDGVPEFHQKVYEIARKIPPGKTLTYGDIAHELGMPGSAQAVGQALGRNPVPIVVPCHRVLAAGGKDGGFSAPGGVSTKRRMLVIEGALADEPTLF